MVCSFYGPSLCVLWSIPVHFTCSILSMPPPSMYLYASVTTFCYASLLPPCIELNVVCSLVFFYRFHIYMLHGSCIHALKVRHLCWKSWGYIVYVLCEYATMFIWNCTYCYVSGCYVVYITLHSCPGYTIECRSYWLQHINCCSWHLELYFITKTI